MPKKRTLPPATSSMTHEMRPVTLHATQILTTKELSKAYGIQDRIVSLHVEIDIKLAKDLVSYLQERIEENHTAGIRIGFEGHLVHG